MTDTPAWTAGPWGDGNEALCVKIDRERPWASTVFRHAHDGTEANALVAMTFAATVEEAVANAHLIAAAPDYAEAAELMIAAEQCGGDLWWKGFEMLKAAHAKARGNQ